MDLETSLSNQNRSNPLPERLELPVGDLVTFEPRLLTDSVTLADIAVRHGAICVIVKVKKMIKQVATV